MTNLEQAPTATDSGRWRESAVDAALALCRERAFHEFDISDIAARAGVDVETLHSRWPDRKLLVAEALLGSVAPRMTFGATGDLSVDLRAQLAATIEVFADPHIGPHLVALTAEASRDQRLAGFFLKHVFGPNRAAARARFELAQEQGQLRTDLDLNTAVDMVFGPIWFRLLLNTGPLTVDLADSLTEHALRGLAPRPETGAPSGSSPA